MSGSSPPLRHVDTGRALGAFAREVLAVCPRCGGPARVEARLRYAFPFLPSRARAQCLRCSFFRELEDARWSGPVLGVARVPCPVCGWKWLEACVARERWRPAQGQTEDRVCPACHRRASLPLRWYPQPFGGGAVDPVFGLPLWLQAPCCGHVLWAYGREHLEELRAYVAARQRERSPASGFWSMVPRLPRWVGAAGNRDAVLRCLDRLEERLRRVEGLHR
jgi:hypothetical protein